MTCVANKVADQRVFFDMVRLIPRALGRGGIIAHVGCSLVSIWVSYQTRHKVACSATATSQDIENCTFSKLSWNRITVKPVLSGHSKLDKTKILLTNGSLMQVESIAECPWSILQYFWPALNGLENQFFGRFEGGPFSTGFTVYRLVCANKTMFLNWRPCVYMYTEQKRILWSGLIIKLLTMEIFILTLCFRDVRTQRLAHVFIAPLPVMTIVLRLPILQTIWIRIRRLPWEQSDQGSMKKIVSDWVHLTLKRGQKNSYDQLM